MAYAERGGNWGVEETELLLKLWGEPRIQHEMLTTIRNLDIYNQIATEMHRSRPRCTRTGLQCRYRVKRLKRDFLRAKNEGNPASFAFYAEMDAILTERAKAAESQEQGRQGGKRKRNRKRQRSAAEAAARADAPAIKIEIDNAEEYEYGVSNEHVRGVSSTAVADSSRVQAGKDSTDDDDDDDDDEDDDAGDEDEGSLPVRFYDNEGDRAVVSRDSSSWSQPDTDSEPQSSAVHGETVPTTSADVSSSVASVADPSSPDTSPLPFVIKSVYHVTEADAAGTSDTDLLAELDRGSTATGRKAHHRDEAADIPSGTQHTSGTSQEVRVDASSKEMDSDTEPDQLRKDGDIATSEGTVGTDRRGAINANTPVLGAGDSGTGSPFIGRSAKVAKQVNKDLQIVAEWTVKTTEPSCGTDKPETSKTKTGMSITAKNTGQPESALTHAAETSGAASKDAVAVKDASQAPAPDKATLPRYKMVDLHTLVRLPGDGGPPETIYLTTTAGSVTKTSPSIAIRALTTLSSRSLLSPSTSGSGSTPFTKPGVSLLATSQRPLRTSSPQSTPKVIVYERSPRCVGATSAGPPSGTSRSGISTSASSATPGSVCKLATSGVLTSKSIVLSSSPTTLTPVRVIRASQGTSLLSSAPAGSKYIRLRPSPSLTTTTVSSARPLASPPVSKQPLTFTTLSSLDPVPKRVTLSPEPSHQPPSVSRSSKTTTIIIPPHSPPTAPSLPMTDVKVVLVPEPTAKDKPEVSCGRYETRSVSKGMRQTAGSKRSHEESEIPSGKKSGVTKREPETSSSETPDSSEPRVMVTESGSDDRTSASPSAAKSPKVRRLSPASLSSCVIANPMKFFTVRTLSEASKASETAGHHVATSTTTAAASTTNAVPKAVNRKEAAAGQSLALTASTATSPAASLSPVPCTPLRRQSEEDLFRRLLSQAELSRECQDWMVQALTRSRASSSAERPPGHVELPAGSAVEVTNLVVNDGSTVSTDKQTGTFKVKAGLAQMAKGGIIMDVTTPEEARVAEEAGACAVMALERVPADIRREGGVARMTDPKKIKEIIAAVTIPVMAKCRIGHFAEAQILECLGVDMVDESEVLTPADEEHHVDKHAFKVPFVCGARDLGEALRRINEGAAMIRTKGEAGTGDVVEAVRHARAISRQIRTAQALDPTELYNYAKELQVPYDLLKKTAELGRLPVVNFAAGGLATPADVSLLMQLGVDGVFVGSGIFKSSDPPSRARAMAQAVTHYKDPKILAALSENLGDAMFGTPVSQRMRAAAAASGNRQQEKLWNATLAMDKVKVTA